MQPPADRGVDPDGPATDAATTPTDGSASIAGWTPPPWTAGPDAPAGWTPPPRTAGPDAFRRIPAGLLIAVALVLVGVFAGWYSYASRSANGEPEVAPAERVDLRVGDCYNSESDRIEDVKEVPCTTEHRYEVIYVGATGEGTYPTLDGFADYVVQYCDPAFGDYVGKAVDDSDLSYEWLVPTQDVWRSGDRTVRCAAYEPGTTSLTRSLRGARQ